MSLTWSSSKACGKTSALLQELDQSVTPVKTRPRCRKQRRYQRFFYQEAFRNLFTSIRFLNSDRPCAPLP